jgi:hypothetical protein
MNTPDLFERVLKLSCGDCGRIETGRYGELVREDCFIEQPELCHYALCPRCVHTHRELSWYPRGRWYID